MKISKLEKAKTRTRIIAAAVPLIAKQSFAKTTMQQIAKAAGVSDATIYNYFKTKELILFGYFEDLAERIIADLKNIEAFEQYSFAEQVHTTLQTQLDLIEPDREFVRVVFEQVFLHNWMTAAAGGRKSKATFLELINDMLNAAVEAGEFSEPPFKGLVGESIWDLSLAMTYYWLKDESEDYQNTTAMIDKAMALIMATLESNILAKAMDLAQFVIREHLISKLNSNTDSLFKNINLMKRKLNFGKD